MIDLTQARILRTYKKNASLTFHNPMHYLIIVSSCQQYDKDGQENKVDVIMDVPVGAK